MTEASKPKLWQNAAAVVKQRKEERKNEWKKRKREVTRAGEVEPLETWYLVWKSSLLWCSKWACIFKEKPKQMYASWFRKKRKKKDRMRDGGRKKTVQKENGKGTFSFFSPPFFLFLCRISPNPPITVMSGWERGRGGGRERLYVTGRIDGGEGGWKKEIHHCFLSVMSVTRPLTLRWLVSED